MAFKVGDLVTIKQVMGRNDGIYEKLNLDIVEDEIPQVLDYLGTGKTTKIIRINPDDNLDFPIVCEGLEDSPFCELELELVRVTNWKEKLR